MSKVINVKNSYYNFNADVVIRDKSGMHIASCGAEGFNSKNTRDIKRAIVQSYANDGITVNASDIMVTNVSKIVEVKSYKVMATNADIIAACRAYGIEVVENDDTDTDPDTDETDTDTDN